ncbi:sulfatase/phosphatase domain-containing protein [Formosa sp. PL04]|uniref:sulfatase/phosphatase domain-containing protein n=1 Tax=Formosa sp. PL04 TaxID=3081755 RepID=UPI002982029E|nr:sulfatase/phosphatase domain-containing protein [Formosa sp. PL04]MDW5290605.1 DUF4976 domain-containing protein [Formosa sp. PL04]
MQGTSFVPLIENPERPWKTAAFSQFHRRPRHAADGNRYMGYSINTKKYHYIEWYTWDPKTGTRGELKNTELFDRESDPYETVNISEELKLSDIVNGLSEQLADGWKKATPNYIE